MSNKVNNKHEKQPDKQLTDIYRVSFISTSRISQVFKSVTVRTTGQVWETQHTQTQTGHGCCDLHKGALCMWCACVACRCMRMHVCVGVCVSLCVCFCVWVCCERVIVCVCVFQCLCISNTSLSSPGLWWNYLWLPHISYSVIINILYIFF